MSRMQVSNFLGVKVYNLSSGKTLPQWISQSKKRSLSKDLEYRQRVELLQDFDFPIASQNIKMSPDSQYVIVTGTYPPQVKVFDTSELGLKFERHLDCDVVAFEMLSENFEKMVFLQADRTIAVHAGYGFHHSLRVPKHGRDLAYQPLSCDLLVGCSGNEVYRLNLDEGRFKPALSLPGDASVGVTKLALNPVHQLLAAGREDGTVSFWDVRAGKTVSQLSGLDLSAAAGRAAQMSANTQQGFQTSALCFDTDGLTLAAGTTSAQCFLFDLRSSQPLLCKQHPYGLPVTDIKFHDGPQRLVVSTDPKIVKMWNRHTGDNHANVETPVATNDVCIAHDARGDSGLVLMAGEQAKVMAYYVPSIGPAPRWCSFLDSLTEELEEQDGLEVFDDYKFVTRTEVHDLGISNLVGTPMLRGYMHGYFIDAKLYAKLKAVAEPFAYEEYKKKKLQERIDAKRQSRIVDLKKAAPKVNQELAKKLLRKQMKMEAQRKAKSKSKGKGGEGGEEEEEEEEEGREGGDAFLPEKDLLRNPLGDDRFASMFKSGDFEVDEQSEAYILRNPSSAPGGGGEPSKRRRRDDHSEDEDEDEEEGQEQGGARGGRRRGRDEVEDYFSPVDSDVGGDEDDDDDDDDDGGGERRGRGRARGGDDGDGGDDDDDDDDDDDNDHAKKQTRKERQRLKKQKGDQWGRAAAAAATAAAGGKTRRKAPPSAPPSTTKFFEISATQTNASNVAMLTQPMSRSAQNQRRNEKNIPLSERVAAAEADKRQVTETRTIIRRKGGGGEGGGGDDDDDDDDDDGHGFGGGTEVVREFTYVPKEPANRAKGGKGGGRGGRGGKGKKR